MSEPGDTVGALIASVDAFCARHVDARAIDAAGRIDRDVLAGLAELGLFGLSLPEAHGGFGLSLVEVGDVVAALARHDRSVATSVGLHLGLGTRGLVAFGSEAQQERWIPTLATGERIAAFATTEAGAGSDLGAIRARAVLDGDQLELEGEKIFVTNGGFADVFTVTVATPGRGDRRRSHGLVVLGREDGVVTGPEEHKLGLRGSSTTTLCLDGVRVGPERILGAPGEGGEQLAHVLAWGRTVMAAGCRGTARAAIDATLAHVATRRQFGRALLSMDVVRAQVSRMRALEHAMTALVRHASRFHGEALATLSASAKVFATEAAWDIVDTAIQLHGGPGYIEETGIALLLRDARVTRIFEGANDVLRVHRGLVEATRASDRSVVGGGRFLGRGEGPPQRPPRDIGVCRDGVGSRAFSGVAGDLATDAPAELRRRADVLHDDVRAWRDALAHTYGARLLARPALLHALGEAAILRDAVDAAVLAVETDADAARAALWLDEARARLGVLLRPLPEAGLLDRALGASP